MKGVLPNIFATLLFAAAWMGISALDQRVGSSGAEEGSGALIVWSAGSAGIDAETGKRGDGPATHADDRHRKAPEAVSGPPKSSPSNQPRPSEPPRQGPIKKKMPGKSTPQEISPAALHVM